MKHFILFLLCIGNCFGQEVKIPPKLHFDFCFSAVNSLSSNTDSSGDHSFYDGAMVNGVQATGGTGGNAYVNIISVTDNSGTSTALPTGWTLDQTTGSLTIPPGTLPTFQVIYFRICPIGSTAGCGPIAVCGVNIGSPLLGTDDDLYFNTDGELVAVSNGFNYVPTGTVYNVLSNDHIYDCANSAFFTATVNYFNTNNGSFTLGTTATEFYIDAATGVLYVNNNGLTSGNSYTLTYTISLTFAGATPVTISETHTVTIYIVDYSAPFSANTTVQTATNKITQPSTTGKSTQFVNFPDINFKNKLLTCTTCQNTTLTGGVIVDANGDGEIDYSEAADVGMLWAMNGNITDVTGLEAFINLRRVVLSYNPITSINTSNLSTHLEYASVKNTNITNFDVSYFPVLQRLDIFNTPITALDLGNNPMFTELYVKNSPNLSYINIKNGINQDVTTSNALADCWQNCPNLTNVCVDASELTAVQNYLTNCGGNASIVNSNCAMGVENAVVNSFTIAPNPSSGVFTVTFGAATLPLAVEVYDVMGRKLLVTPSAVEGQQQLDLSNYPSGAYFVSIKTETGTMKQTIIKK